MNINEVKGVTAKRKKPVVIPVPYTPENQWISRDEFIRRRQAQKAAKAAADAAYQKELAKAQGNTPVTPPKEDETPQLHGGQPQAERSSIDLDKLRKKLANAEAKLQENPKSKAWQKKLQDAQEALEMAEAEAGEE